MSMLSFCDSLCFYIRIPSIAPVQHLKPAPNTSWKPWTIGNSMLFIVIYRVHYSKSGMFIDCIDNVPIAVECFCMTYTIWSHHVKWRTPREPMDCASKSNIRWYRSIRNMSWSIIAFLSCCSKNVWTKRVCKTFEGWELYPVCPSEVHRAKLLIDLRYRTSRTSTAQATFSSYCPGTCLSSTWTRTTIFHKRSFAKAATAVATKIVLSTAASSMLSAYRSVRVVLVETIMVILCDDKKHSSMPYVLWRSNDETSRFSRSTFKRKLGSV